MTSLDIRCTSQCNYRCTFCHCADSLGTGETPLRMLAKLCELLDGQLVESLSITGGEPLLCPEVVLAIINIARAQENPCHITVNTNGSLLDGDLVSLLNFYDVTLGISLHGIEGEKGILEAVKLGGNPDLVKHIISVHNKIIKRVVRPAEEFHTQVHALHELFGAPIDLFLDITANFGPEHLIFLDRELQRLKSLDSSAGTWVSFANTTKSCGYDQLSLSPLGELTSVCSPPLAGELSGCRALVPALGADGLVVLYDIIDRFTKDHHA